MTAYSGGYGLSSAYRVQAPAGATNTANVRQLSRFDPSPEPAVNRGTPVPLLTDSGDYTTVNGSGASFAINKPANTADGDLLIAVVSYQTALAAGQTVSEGTGAWKIFGPAFVNDATRRGATTWALPVASAAALPASWTWTNSTGGARYTATVFRVTGADISNGLISAAGGESELSAWAANTDPTIPAFTAGVGELVIACAIAQNTSTQAPPVSWSPSGYTTHTGSYANTATGGVSWSAHYIATKTGTSASESDTAATLVPTPAGAMAWGIAVQGAPVAAGTITLGLATETDTAFALSRAKTATAGFPAETDTAPAVVTSKTVTLGLAVENDTAAALTSVKASTLGLPTETDTGAALVRTKTITLGLPTETDTAHPLTISGSLTVTLGLPVETSTAPPLSAAKSHTLGFPAEADTAAPLVRTKIITLGLPVESSSAQPLTPTKAHILGLPVTTDTAASVALTKALGFGLPAETDTAHPLVFVPPRDLEGSFVLLPGRRVTFTLGPDRARARLAPDRASFVLEG